MYKTFFPQTMDIYPNPGSKTGLQTDYLKNTLNADHATHSPSPSELVLRLIGMRRKFFTSLQQTISNQV